MRQNISQPAARTQCRGCCTHPVSKMGTTPTLFLGSLLLCSSALVCFLLFDLRGMSMQLFCCLISAACRCSYFVHFGCHGSKREEWRAADRRAPPVADLQTLLQTAAIIDPMPPLCVSFRFFSLCMCWVRLRFIFFPLSLITPACLAHGLRT